MTNWSDIKFNPVNLPIIGSDPAYLPDADCENCKYTFHRGNKSISNEHCYLFEVKPGTKCGQFKRYPHND